MDSYNVEIKATLKISLQDKNAEVGPVPTQGGGRRAKTELEPLSII